MISRASSADVPRIVEMFRAHHVEKHFDFAFNSSRITKTVSSFIGSNDALVLVSDTGLLIASVFDSPFGAGKLAIEHIARARGDFDDFVEAYEQWARQHGCAHASISCTDRHAAFARLYRRRGYALAESTFSKAL